MCDLKAANPAFKMTAFAVPMLGSDSYWDSLPDWIELANHGEYHRDSREAENWSYEKAMDVLLSTPGQFCEGHKSPGWMISDGMYQALMELEWWVADKHWNDYRRPEGLRVHCDGDGDHVHTHVGNVEGNGLEETFPTLLERVIEAKSFQFVSEAVKPWAPAKVAA